MDLSYGDGGPGRSTPAVINLRRILKGVRSTEYIVMKLNSCILLLHIVCRLVLQAPLNVSKPLRFSNIWLTGSTLISG